MSHAKMPVLFVGHGSPMNSVSNNAYTRSLKSIAPTIPKPDAILVVSAHWLTKGTFVCTADKPEQIYDFYGFPEHLHAVQYHPAGAPKVAESILHELKSENILPDTIWGIDHASWAVLVHMYPDADIPVFEMSLDITKTEQAHYALANKLAFLRRQNVLVIGSGNIVHNLARIEYQEDATPYPWATEFDLYVKEALLQENIDRLVRYRELSPVGKIAAPTNDHYLPMLYSMAIREKGEQIDFFHESIQNASISMRCFVIR
jgi:4,5-DOPA dioxygenase extradiol